MLRVCEELRVSTAFAEDPSSDPSTQSGLYLYLSLSLSLPITLSPRNLVPSDGLHQYCIQCMHATHYTSAFTQT